MRGRTPKPTAVKLLEGNRGKRPLPSGEPRPPTGAPTCPAHLNPTAKAEWRRVVHSLRELSLITTFDRAALASYCQAYGHWVEAERNLRNSPMLLRMPSGYIQQNPWLTIANKQLELMHRYITEFGFTPAARTRIDTRSLYLNAMTRDDPASEFLD